MQRWILLTSALVLAACEPPPRWHVDSSTVRTGTDVVVTFDVPPSGQATDQLWVALQPASAPDSDVTGRLVLERSERVVRLRTTVPGAFEVRVHGRYPGEEHHLLGRVPVTVSGWPVKTGIEPRIPPERI